MTHSNDEIIEAYLQAVLQKNNELNLTTIRSIEKARILHIQDSLSAIEDVNSAPKGKLADIGTGGGFPGVPLAIVTGRKATLVDSRQKKIQAIMQIIKDLKIENINAFTGRIEELGCKNPNEYAVVTARALATLPVLLEFASPLLIQQGRLIAYKLSTIEDELSAAVSIQEKLGMQYLYEKEVNLGDSFPLHKIVVFQKVGEPLVKLPRKNGIAQKRPFA